MALPRLNNFQNNNLNSLSSEHVKLLEAAAKRARINALTMVKLANSGHPGGAFSSMEMFLSVYGMANLTPENCNDFNRDYVVISHGHASAGVYAAMAEWGFFDAEEAAAHFRQFNSPFQGHVERCLPGIDWGTGNLGQGLSAGAGFALALRARNFKNNRVYVLMGDGGQTKGQLAEARRLIVSEKLNNVIALIDLNNIQISGRTHDVMPCNVKELWAADGWEVVECDGHSFSELYSALKNAGKNNKPTVILCKTLIGKDGGAMEDTPEYHGKAPSDEIFNDVVKKLGGEPEVILSKARERRNAEVKFKGREVKYFTPIIDTGENIDYDKIIDNRGAFGKALADVAKINKDKKDSTPILVFDCDLMPSVMTGEFKKVCPENFIQCGIQEHTTATASGAAASAGVISVWADFGVFGIDEVYNQQRLNDINHAGNKTVLTHVGLDVGEDGKTHQCIDYIGLIKNTFGWKIVVPADPSQTDRITRWMLRTPGCICLAVGRSKINPLKLNDKLIFGGDYEFEYGKAIKIKDGRDGSIFALGYMAEAALKSAEILFKDKNLDVAVYSVSCPLEPDLNALKEACNSKFILTVEDHIADTGMGALMALAMARNNLNAKIKNLGVTRYGDSCPSNDARAAMGLTPENIADEFLKLRN